MFSRGQDVFKGARCFQGGKMLSRGQDDFKGARCFQRQISVRLCYRRISNKV